MYSDFKNSHSKIPHSFRQLTFIQSSTLVKLALLKENVDLHYFSNHQCIGAILIIRCPRMKKSII